MKYQRDAINENLRRYIEKIINYHYNLNDKGHGIEHAEYVINSNLSFVNNISNIVNKLDKKYRRC